MISFDSSALVKRFLQLSAIPGVSRRERPIIDFLKSWLQKSGFDAIEDKAGDAIGGEAGNLICKVESPASHAPVFLLAAHVDTVNESCTAPAVKDGRIVSTDHRILGADDRAGVAVLIEILEQISMAKIRYPNLEIVFLVAEEIGLEGSKNLDYSMITARDGFNFDCSAPVGHVVVAAPSKINFEMRFRGKAAHAAVAPEKGLSAITMAAEAIYEIDRLPREPDMVFNIGQIEGGGSSNVVPENVTSRGEIRSFDAATIDSRLRKVADIGQKVAGRRGGRFEFDQTLKYPFFRMAEQASVLGIARKAIESAGLRFTPLQYLAGSDANIFNNNNISAVNLGLGYVNNHSSEEFITVDSLLKGAEVGVRIVEIASGLRDT